MTKLSRSNRCYGWMPDVPDHRDHLYAAPLVHIAKLPARVDLRPLCPQVYDQGEHGSCTANAIGAAIHFERRKQKLKPDFSPSRLFVYYNERVMEHTVSSDAGAQIRDGIKSVATQGDCPEKDWPYVISKFADKPAATCYRNAAKYKAVSYQRVPQVLNPPCSSTVQPTCNSAGRTSHRRHGAGLTAESPEQDGWRKDRFPRRREATSDCSPAQ